MPSFATPIILPIERGKEARVFTSEAGRALNLRRKVRAGNNSYRRLMAKNLVEQLLKANIDGKEIAEFIVQKHAERLVKQSDPNDIAKTLEMAIRYTVPVPRAPEPVPERRVGNPDLERDLGIEEELKLRRQAQAMSSEVNDEQ